MSDSIQTRIQQFIQLCKELKLDYQEYNQKLEPTQHDDTIIVAVRARQRGVVYECDFDVDDCFCIMHHKGCELGLKRRFIQGVRRMLEYVPDDESHFKHE
jgi:hypothetical protein